MQFDLSDKIFFLLQLNSRNDKSYYDTLNKLEYDFNSLTLNQYRYLTITITDAKCVQNLTAAISLMSDKFNDLFAKLKEKYPHYYSMANFVPVER